MVHNFWEQYLSLFDIILKFYLFEGIQYVVKMKRNVQNQVPTLFSIFLEKNKCRIFKKGRLLPKLPKNKKFS